MTKYEIELPKQIHYSMTIPIRLTELTVVPLPSKNIISHLAYDSLFSIVRETFACFLMHNGYSESNIAGKSIIIPSCLFLNHEQVHFGEVMKGQVSINDIGNKSFNAYIRLVKENTNTLVASAKLGIIFFNYDTNKSEPIPEEFKNKFN